jgi:hypothetical protein
MLGTGMLMAMEIPENQLRKATKRHASPRPVVRLFIPRGSPLAEGRLPVQKQEVDGGWFVNLDPISLAALLTSVGKQCAVQQASREMPGLTRSDQLSSDEDESSTEDEL